MFYCVWTIRTVNQKVFKLCLQNLLINKFLSTLQGKTDGVEAGADEKKQTNEFI